MEKTRTESEVLYDINIGQSYLQRLRDSLSLAKDSLVPGIVRVDELADELALAKNQLSRTKREVLVTENRIRQIEAEIERFCDELENARKEPLRV